MESDQLQTELITHLTMNRPKGRKKYNCAYGPKAVRNRKKSIAISNCPWQLIAKENRGKRAKTVQMSTASEYAAIILCDKLPQNRVPPFTCVSQVDPRGWQGAQPPPFSHLDRNRFTLPSYLNKVSS